ncbi:hypothetical protein HPB47_014312 [Ixodes persulcatus]|uniref:Uncharacterized protein n=1 Tax=Ixodes persulcatus TaxID=34615 RepID=A0AC60QYR9_IXOPE|nr:hypothetical protein HPB47_014312 [Ixodes persulcatus]
MEFNLLLVMPGEFAEFSGLRPGNKLREQAFKNHLRTAAQYTDVFWEQVRTSLVKKGAANVRKQEDVTILGGATLPPNIKSALNHEPKFSQEPRLCPLTKLSLVRWMGGLAVPEHQERCVADGVDVLQRTAGQSTRSFKTSNIVTYFSEHNLKLVTADKEGGFVVAPSALYGVKASQAIDKNFKRVRQRSHPRARCLYKNDAFGASCNSLQ